MTSVSWSDPSDNETLLRLTAAYELRERLTGALLLLPVQERLVFTLYYYEGLTTEEIKLLLGDTESSISQLHAAALFRLHASLADRAICVNPVVAASAETIQ
jgi:RNA polymerase sigma factor (sigma-70 family)